MSLFNTVYSAFPFAFRRSSFIVCLAGLVLCGCTTSPESMQSRNEKHLTAWRTFPSRQAVEPRPVPGVQSGTLQMLSDPAISQGRLSNGLGWVFMPAESGGGWVSLRLIVKAGSLQEEDSQRGFAHFVEHMGFNGSTHFKPGEALTDSKRGGMTCNAWTSFDTTCYQVEVKVENYEVLARAWLLLQDFALGMAFDPVEVDKERAVVLQEKMVRRGNDLPAELPLTEHASRFNERDPIGTEECLRKAQAADLRRFRDTWYRPNLMTVAVCGKIDPVLVQVEIEKLFGPRVPGMEPGRDAWRIEYDWPLNVRSNARIRAQYEKDAVQFDLLRIQAFKPEGTVVDLYRKFWWELTAETWRIRMARDEGNKEAGIQESWARSWRIFSRRELQGISARYLNSRADAAGKAFFAVQESLRAFGATKGEFDRASDAFRSRYQAVLAGTGGGGIPELADGMVDSILKGEALLGPKEEARLALAWLDSINLEDQKKWFPVFLKDDGMNLDVLANTEQSGIMASWFLDDYAKVRAEPPKSPPSSGDDETHAVKSAASSRPSGNSTILGEKVLGDNETRVWKLQNQIQVLARQTNPGSGEFAWYFMSPGGTSCVPDDLVESAVLLPRTIARTLVLAPDAKQQEEFLKNKGISINIFMGTDQEGFFGTCRKGSEAVLMELISGYCLPEALDEDNFDRALDEGARQVEQGQYNLMTMRDVMLAAGDRRLLPLTPESIQQVTPEDTLTVWKDRFGDCGDFVFCAAGEYDETLLKSESASRLGSLPSTGRRDRPALKLAFPDQDLAESSPWSTNGSSWVLMSRVAPVLGKDCDLAILLALRSRLAELLMAGIREELGLSYSLQVQVAYRGFTHQTVQWDIVFDCKPGREEAARARVRQILADLGASEMPDPEYQAFWAGLAQGLRPAAFNNQVIAMSLLAPVLGGSEPSEVPGLLDQLQWMEAADLQAAMKKYFAGPGWMEVWVTK